MSFSFGLPEEPPICECFYDEVRDAMDRDDCPFHCDVIDTPDPVEFPATEGKRPAVALGKRATEDAA